MPEPDDNWLVELSRALTSMNRRTRSASFHEDVAARAGVKLKGPLLGVLFRIRDLQPVRISTVADAMGYERSTVSRQVTELVKLGLLDRQRDERDGRATLLALSNVGASTVTEVQQSWLAVLGEATEGWSAAERHSFLESLAALDRAIGERMDRPQRLSG